MAAVEKQNLQVDQSANCRNWELQSRSLKKMNSYSRKVEVDSVLNLAERAGATITDPAHDTFWGGYSSHFMDPDGHLWEIVYNPEWAQELT